MNENKHLAIAYSLRLSASSIRLSRVPGGWSLSSMTVPWAEFLSQFDSASQRHVKATLKVLKPGEAGRSLNVADKAGVKWALTATLSADKWTISGALMSLAIEQSERQMRGLLNHLPSLIWYKDDANRILGVNSAAAASVGKTVREIEGQRTEDLFPDMAKAYLEDDLTVIKSGIPRLGYIERLAPADRQDRWVKTDKIPFRDPVTGHPGVVAMSTDVTKLVELEQQNADLNRRFSAAAKASGVGLWEYSLSDVGEAWWSAELFTILGIQPSSPPSLEACLPMAHPDDKSILIGLYQSLVEQQEPFSVQFRVRHTLGHYFWIEAEGRVDQDETGKAVRIRGSFKNVDARRQSEDALKIYAAQLEAANEKLDSFAYIASHDLKAPLRGLSNLVSWVEEDLPRDARLKVEDSLNLMRSRLSRMENLLKDLRLYSKAGREVGVSHSIDLAVLLPELLEFSNEGVKGDAAQVVLELDAGLPQITCSESAARHVFLNLISNAIKHGDEDMAVLRVSAQSGPDGVSVSFEDNGKGIDLDYRERVFLPFKTLRPRDDVEGSGIGLAIVKKMMGSLGGSASVEEPQHGSGARIALFFPHRRHEGSVRANPTIKAAAS